LCACCIEKSYSPFQISSMFKLKNAMAQCYKRWKFSITHLSLRITDLS
jgi:hypothetical protein